jgi:hypothetical protein
MTILYSNREIRPDLAAWLNSGPPPFAVVELTGDGMTTMTFATSAEAYAMRDAVQRAGDLLAEAEGGAS